MTGENTPTVPANIYLFKANNGKTTKMCEMCSELIKKQQNDVTDVV